MKFGKSLEKPLNSYSTQKKLSGAYISINKYLSINSRDLAMSEDLEIHFNITLLILLRRNSGRKTFKRLHVKNSKQLIWHFL